MDFTLESKTIASFRVALPLILVISVTAWRGNEHQDNVAQWLRQTQAALISRGAP